MKELSKEEEIKIIRELMIKNPHFKIENAQRRILKGYMYTAKLVEEIKSSQEFQVRAELTNEEEIEIIKQLMLENPNLKVEDVQRRILKGYIYTAKLIDEVKTNI